MHCRGGFPDVIGHVLHEPGLVRAESSTDLVTHGLSFSELFRAPTEHRCPLPVPLPPNDADVPEGPTASISLSLHAYVDRQHE